MNDVDLGIILSDVKKLRDGLYDLLEGEVEEPKDRDIVIQQGIQQLAKTSTLGMTNGDKNSQFQFVNITYNRAAHLKVILLLKVIDNIVDNLRDYSLQGEDNQKNSVGEIETIPINDLSQLIAEWDKSGTLMSDALLEVALAYYKFVRGKYAYRTGAINRLGLNPLTATKLEQGGAGLSIIRVLSAAGSRK